MAKTKLQKKEIIEDLKQNLINQKAIVFVDFQGLGAKALSELRNDLKEADCLLKVTKKTLLGLVFESLKELVPAKIIYQFTKENENLKILGGLVKNKEYRFLTIQEVIDLALLPSREEVFARLIGTLNAPVTNFVDVLKGNLRNFVFILKEKVKQ